MNTISFFFRGDFQHYSHHIIFSKKKKASFCRKGKIYFHLIKLSNMTHRYVTCTNSKTNRLYLGSIKCIRWWQKGRRNAKFPSQTPVPKSRTASLLHWEVTTLVGQLSPGLRDSPPPPASAKRPGPPPRPLHNSGSSPCPRTTFSVRELIPAAAGLHRPCTHSPQGALQSPGTTAP